MAQPRSRPAALVGKEGANHSHPESHTAEIARGLVLHCSGFRTAAGA